MKEDFLHYVWKYQKFNSKGLRTENGESITVIDVGKHNTNSGPDFFNALLAIGNQVWAGNVEIHSFSSDWYVHQHERDPAYDTVILHVVWVYDAEVFRKNNTAIPTLVLKSMVPEGILSSYHHLFSKKQKWIPCENELSEQDDFMLNKWLERLFIERLEHKTIQIELELKSLNNHWEALLFRLLCKSFGLKVNGASFLSVAQSIDFSIVQKCQGRQDNMESLLLGQAGLLDGNKADGYYNFLQKKYCYLRRKYGLNNESVIAAKYFRLRPVNFPTIRLSQFATLYTTKKQLFSDIISLKGLEDYYLFFNIGASSYWDTHFNFGVTTCRRRKVLSKKFVDLLLMNTIIPMKFCYANKMGIDVLEELIQLATQIHREENSIVKKFNDLKPIVFFAYQSQAILELKTNYCDKRRCADCAIGNAILRG